MSLFHALQVVLPAEAKALGSTVKGYPVDQFEKDGRQISVNTNAARKLFDVQMSSKNVPKKVWKKCLVLGASIIFLLSHR